MPKDEFDFNDPMELSGIALFTAEDTTGPMCDCFIEEFLRLGHSASDILGLFGDPFYMGMNLVMQSRGEGFVRERIEEIFAQWGRPVAWATPDAARASAAMPSSAATSSR